MFRYQILVASKIPAALSIKLKLYIYNKLAKDMANKAKIPVISGTYASFLLIAKR